MTEPNEYLLTVKRNDLEKGINTAMHGIKKKTTGHFSISYAGGKLTLRGPMAEEVIPAKGDWPMTVKVPIQIAKNLAKVLTASNEQRLRFKDSRLYIENFSIAAERE